MDTDFWKWKDSASDTILYRTKMRVLGIPYKMLGINLVNKDRHMKTKNLRNVEKDWDETMDMREVVFCVSSINAEIQRLGVSNVDNYRAARMWKSSQRRRFKRDEHRGCCGSHNFVATKWSWSKFRFDVYLLGFNYGH